MVVKKTIAIVIKADVGGVTNYSLSLLLRLKENKIDVKLIVQYFANQDKLNFISSHPQVLDDCIFIYFDEKNNIQKEAKDFEKLLIYNNIDCLIANDSAELRLIQIRKVAIKLIFILHGDYSHYYDTAVNNRGIIDLFVCVSKQIRSKLLKINPTFHTFVLGPSVNKPRGIIKNNCGLTTITFIGRPDESKGFHVILKLIEKSDKFKDLIKWNIILGGDIIELNKFSNVDFFYNIDNARVMHFLADSDIFILPSRAEGFPISLIEALFYENLCITSDLEVFQDILKYNKLGFTVSNEDVVMYWKVIMEIVESVELRNAFIQRIRNFDWSGYLFNDQFINVLLEIRDLNNCANDFVIQELGILDSIIIPNFLTYLTRKYVR